jgi:hypothetical protein
MQHYRAPFVERTARKPMLAWPREIPIAGEPADVVTVVSRYRDALCQSQLPKLLFTVEPGMLVRAPLLAWCRASLPKLDVIARPRIALRARRSSARDRRAHRGPDRRRLVSIEALAASGEWHIWLKTMTTVGMA